jgi:hypothetical protein
MLVRLLIFKSIYKGITIKSTAHKSRVRFQLDNRVNLDKARDDKFVDLTTFNPIQQQN